MLTLKTNALKYKDSDGTMKNIGVVVGGDSNITTDDALSETSTNPVQNAAVTKAINQLTQDIEGVKQDVSEAELLLEAI